MRVLHVSPSSARREGGPSEVLRGLLPALAEHGVDWRLVTTDKGATASDADLLSDDRVTVAKSRVLASWTYASDLRGPLQTAIRASDVVHIHSIHTFPTSLAMVLARRLRKPFVLEPHGALDKYHLRQGAFKKRAYSGLIDGRSLRALGGAIYSSAMEMEEGLEFLPHVPAHVMPLGVPDHLFEISSQGDRDPATILFLGRITEKKRLDLVLQALATPELRQTNARLIVAGPDDPHLPYNPRQLASELGVAANVSFLGQVDSYQRARLLSSATVFVLPSEDESFGMAVAEALAAGCPVVSSNHVGIAPDASRAGALRTTDLTPTGLARTLRGVLVDPTARLQMADVARAYAKSNFTWQVASHQIVAVYRELVNTNRLGT